ncbi:hypothetical protein EVJ58_g965 [Rhodofomes roseus]|uniref:Uncharacterized protein n=1 Tax=Rhodofomes roseus TaxID=34475 RepID=A0A4Y9Z594_9APHY|nr:hypothetical protein EVJ58_g965 [Rhodofomes roseus]
MPKAKPDSRRKAPRMVSFRAERQLLPLPNLQLPHDPADALEVRVQRQPAIGEGEGLTWIVDEQPRIRLGKDQHITLIIGDTRSGVGRITHVTDMRRHWVTWTVDGGPKKCSLRVPVPWALLSDLEGLAHTRHYPSLPPLPAPHPIYRNNPLITRSTTTPYEFDIKTNTHDAVAEALNKITGNPGNEEAQAEEDGTNKGKKGVSEGSTTRDG